jgi:hypothetical protein
VNAGRRLKAAGRIAALVAAVAVPETARAGEATTPIAAFVGATGAFERMIVTTDKPLELGDLVRSADLIVEASPSAVRSFLAGRTPGIFSDYTFTLHDIIKNRRKPGLLLPGGSILVRRESGTVTMDGVTATSIENDFPAFGGGQRYLLFLKESQDDVYVVVGSGRGAFDSAAEIAPLAMLADQSCRRAPRERFLGEIRALLKFTQ